MLDILNEAVRRGISMESFQEYNPHIPADDLAARVKALRGVVSADQYIQHTTLVQGLGRLSVEGTTKQDERFQFPASDLNRPFVIEAQEDWRLLVINGTNFGTVYNPLIEQNPLRLALAYAEKHHLDAVVLTNPLNVEFKKAVGS